MDEQQRDHVEATFARTAQAEAEAARLTERAERVINRNLVVGAIVFAAAFAIGLQLLGGRGDTLLSGWLGLVVGFGFAAAALATLRRRGSLAVRPALIGGVDLGSRLRIQQALFFGRPVADEDLRLVADYRDWLGPRRWFYLGCITLLATFPYAIAILADTHRPPAWVALFGVPGLIAAASQFWLYRQARRATGSH